MPELAWDIGYSDQACWVMYERRPGGSILVLDTGEVEETMSDFKVGDVVRWRHGRDSRAVTVETIYMGSAGVPCINGAYADGARCDGWYADRFSLVSRPSEAKPALKPGDRVITKRGLYGILRGDSDVPGFRWKVEVYDHNGPDGFATNLREHEVMLAPALKVGDRVRMRRGGWRRNERETGTIERLYTGMGGPAAEVRMDAGSVTTGMLAWMELLPPEPASNKGPYRYDPTHACDCNPLGQIGHPCVCRLRAPMTATEASRKPMLTPEGRPMTVQEAVRHLGGQLPPAAVPTPDSGWMPAGTYMPLEAPEPKSQASASGRELGGYSLADVASVYLSDSPWRGEYLDKGITKSIPLYSRRFPSRTLTWTDLGDEYDLLSDAE